MKNHKIVFANQKGGVGKSTLCMLFANYLAWKKQDVCIIDTDLQKTIMMQRKKDREIYDDMEEPYTVQDFDVQDPELMQQLMESASQTEGFVLFDSPGNVSEDGLVPMFTGADFIICPYEYEEKTLDSTGTFIQVINALRQATPEMTARLFFVPNRIDVRIGTDAAAHGIGIANRGFRAFRFARQRVGRRSGADVHGCRLHYLPLRI